MNASADRNPEHRQDKGDQKLKPNWWGTWAADTINDNPES
jgi:hypothetical protein